MTHATGTVTNLPAPFVPMTEKLTVVASRIENLINKYKHDAQSVIDYCLVEASIVDFSDVDRAAAKELLHKVCTQLEWRCRLTLRYDYPHVVYIHVRRGLPFNFKKDKPIKVKISNTKKLLKVSKGAVEKLNRRRSRKQAAKKAKQTTTRTSGASK